MDYLQALTYSSHRADPVSIRRELELAQHEFEQIRIAHDLASPGNERDRIWGRRRACFRRVRGLELRLEWAEAFAVYDWEQGEREFIEQYAAYISPESLAEWRRSGVPLRVLRQALRHLPE
jgi:hypothetical protein